MLIEIVVAVVLEIVVVAIVVDTGSHMRYQILNNQGALISYRVVQHF